MTYRFRGLISIARNWRRMVRPTFIIWIFRTIWQALRPDSSACRGTRKSMLIDMASYPRICGNRAPGRCWARGTTMNNRFFCSQHGSVKMGRQLTCHTVVAGRTTFGANGTGRTMYINNNWVSSKMQRITTLACRRNTSPVKL